MRKRSRPTLSVLVALPLLTVWALGATAEDDHQVELKLKIPGVQAVYLEPVTGADGGAFQYRVEMTEGTRRLTPVGFSRLVYDQHHGRPIWKTLLNVTSPIGIAWVGLGLLGQLLFTGRMVLQWLTSEKEGRSVVPTAFWWMSLGGASMLLVYFVWRRDLVGVLGQSTGWFIYARNLHLIHSSNAESAAE